MIFFERYAAACQRKGYDPCSISISKIIGASVSTISHWKQSAISPKGDILVNIADNLDVSCDYLLGRTDDMTDYTKMMYRTTNENVIRNFERLDTVDKKRIEGYMDGLLVNEKYNKKNKEENT